MNKVNLDWASLSFAYIKTDYRYVSTWKDGAWDAGALSDDNRLRVAEGATCLHYGQQGFEGLKAYTRADGRVQLFRPDRNAARMNDTADRMRMPPIPVEQFVDACVQVVKANLHWVPPYGYGASLYLRPFMIGMGDNLGVRPAPEYLFSVFCSPVGPYFKKGFKPVNVMTSEYDRAAPHGTGAAKVGGNYAASLLPHDLAAANGFADCIYLDPATHTKIEEVGAANFFGITRDGVFVTPKSPSILPSITKYSLMQLARDYFGMKVEERDVYIDALDEFAEAGACGTAAVITPIGGIQHNGRLHSFYSQTDVGPVTQKLYDTLVGIQLGTVPAPEGWLKLVE